MLTGSVSELPKESIILHKELPRPRSNIIFLGLRFPESYEWSHNAFLHS